MSQVFSKVEAAVDSKRVHRNRKAFDWLKAGHRVCYILSTEDQSMQRTVEEEGKERMEYARRTEEGRSHTSGDGKTVRINPLPCSAAFGFCCRAAARSTCTCTHNIMILFLRSSLSHEQRSGK